jgi:hypothetical protein
MSHFDDDDTQKRTTISTFTGEHAKIAKEHDQERQQAQSLWSGPDERSIEELQASIEKILLALPPLEEHAADRKEALNQMTQLAQDMGDYRPDEDGGALVCA